MTTERQFINSALIVEIVLSTDMAKQTIIYVKCCADWFICLTVFFIYCVCLISVCYFFSFMLCYHIRWWNEVVYINWPPNSPDLNPLDCSFWGACLDTVVVVSFETLSTWKKSCKPAGSRLVKTLSIALYPLYQTFFVMLMTHYLKRFWKIVITFCIHSYQKTKIILGNAHVTKPSYLKQLT